ncbi:MAG: hypothetical protein XD92_0167 [Proteiniphilum acetatigenes]|uniref:Uncharacterized protein n=1 Tax=Proteiniphilum acetatigenes TaxID=294710 RepID=A0A124FXN7_9BACT|nr:MAG: hypothetical protein XD92_0167 [Proteiniphilum acetatigenes]
MKWFINTVKASNCSSKRIPSKSKIKLSGSNIIFFLMGAKIRNNAGKGK